MSFSLELFYNLWFLSPCHGKFYFLLFKGQYFKALPYILMGALAISGGVLCLLLPETYGKALPETIPQMQQICRRGEKKEKEAENGESTADNQNKESKL